MEIQNLNFISISIFLFISIFIWFLFYKFIKNTIHFNKSYKLLSSWKYFYIKYLFLLLSFFTIFIGIFWIKYWDNKKENSEKWIDMIFVLDVSKSMNVFDIENSNNLYSRLYIAKKAIADYVIKNNSNRYWLIIFAWDAVSISPLTFDTDIFLTFLDNVDYRNLVSQWSDFNKALKLWIDRFNNEKERSKSLVFISDWWDKEDNISYSSIKNISKNIENINYFVAGIWTDDWWKIIVWKDNFWWYKYQKYNWEYVISKLNESSLKDISNAINWEYLKISKVNDLQKLNTKIQKLEKKAIESNTYWNKNNINRLLTIYSFIFFISFLIIYIFEDKILWIKK